MARKEGLDDSVIERRLRPIYEWLDLGLPRKAIQECDKVLKKQPNLARAKVLKGLALLRLGKPEDAEKTISQVVAECPTEDSALQALTVYFREIHELERICEIYEEATKKEPNNEDLLSHLFMSYVRVGNYKKQQKTAVALNKLKPKLPYYFWAIISFVMQAREADATDNSKQVCLTLAERMVQKLHKEDKLEAEAEVLTYLYILELQKKYKEALELLSTNLSSKITQQQSNFVQLKRVQYHMELLQWNEALDICKELIKSELDNWQHYENFCMCAMQLYLQQKDAEGQEDLTVLLDSIAFLRTILSESSEKYGTTYRAPYLAMLQFIYQLNASSLQELNSQLDLHVETELYSYLEKFGGKWCAISDVKKYFALLPEGTVKPLLEKLYDLVSFTSDGVPEDIPALYRHLTWLQMKRCLDTSERDAEDLLKEADDLLSMYNKTHHLSDQFTPTDIRRNDCYLLLSCNSVLLALNELSRKPKIMNGHTDRPSPHDSIVNSLLVKLSTLLQAGVAISQANFQLKLLLLQVNNIIGACGSNRGCYESLEIKSVQLDTLGNVLALQSLDVAHYDIAQSVISQANSFFVSAAKDIGEPMIQAYRYGSLTRIPEFKDFRDRLENSVHFATITTEQMLLHLSYSVTNHKSAVSDIESHQIDPVKDKTDYSSLVDNTDYNVKLTWRKTSALPINDKKSSPVKPAKETVQYLVLRNALLRLFTAANNLVSSFKSDKSDFHRAQLTTILTQLQEAMDDFQEEKTVSEMDFLTLGCNRSLLDFKQGSYINCIILHANLVLHAFSCHQAQLVCQKTGATGNCDVAWQSSQLKACEDSLGALFKTAQDTMASLRCTASSAVPSSATHLQSLHNTAQTVGLVMVLLGFSSSIIRTFKASPKKNKKNKKEVPTSTSTQQPESVQQFTLYMSWVEEQLENLHSAVVAKLDSSKQNSVNSKNSYSHVTSSFLSSLKTVESSMQQLALSEPTTNGVNCDEKTTEVLPKPDFVQTCLDIDASYHESLSNIKQSLGAKIKYAANIRP